MKKLVLLLACLLAAPALRAQIQDALTITTGSPPRTSVASFNYTGTRGQTRYCYWVVATYPAGSTLGTVTCTNQGPGTLSASNYITPQWGPTGATSYTLLYTSDATQPQGACTCAVAIATTALSANDQGTRLAYTVPSNLGPATGRISLDNQSYDAPRIVTQPGLQLTGPGLYFPDGTNQTTAYTGGATSGTVTSVSSGNLSPLFTALVATATTTPALSFTAVNQNANVVYAGPGTAPAAAPTFRALVAADLPAGTGTVTSVSGSSPIASTGGTTPAISLNDTAVTPGAYTYAGFTVDAKGRLTVAVSGTPPVTTVTGTAPIASSGGATPAISLNNTAVTPGSYTLSSITVDAQGRITAASNGSSSGLTNNSTLPGIAVGTGSTASTSSGLAIGNTAIADVGSIALGYTATGSTFQYITCVGSYTSCGGDNSTALGVGAQTAGNGNISIGPNARTNNAGSAGAIAIGNTANASDNAAGIVIGSGAVGSNGSNVVIGASSTASGINAVVVGQTATATGSSCVALGSMSTCSGGSPTIAIGFQSISSGNDSVAIGRNSASGAGGAAAVAIGRDSASTGSDSIAIGHGVTNAVDNTVNIGTNSIVLGKLTPTGFTPTGGYLTTTNCSDSAGAAACGSAAAGSFVIDAASTSTVVSTTGVTANSQIFLLEDSSLGTRLGVTCNTQSSLVLGTPVVTARTAGTSFTATIVVGPTTNPMCLSYFIVN